MLVAAGLAAYANSLGGAFVFDDTPHILANERIQAWQNLGPILGGPRPVVDLTLALNHTLGGFDPWGYHAVNLVVHVAAALSLYGLVRRLLALRLNGNNPGSSSTTLAFVVALLWELHPLQTQSVTYVIQRAESLMGMFYLWTLYSTVRGAYSQRPAGWYVAAIACFALAMGSKIAAITAPICALIVDRAFLADSMAKCLRRRWLVYIGFVLVVGLFSMGRPIRAVLDPGNNTATVGFGYGGVSPFDYALTQPGVILRYLSLALWPSPLCLDYRWPTASASAEYVPQVAALGLILLATLWRVFHRGEVAAIPLCFLVTLAPTSSFVPVKDALFEHRMYLPLACVVLAVVLGADSLWRHVGPQAMMPGAFRRFAPAGATIITAASLLWATHRRNTAYQSAVGMWRDVVAKRPNNARAYEQLGTCLIREKRLSEAIDAYRSAVTVDAQFATSWANLSNALLQAGRAAEAVEAFENAIGLDPTNVDMRINRAFAMKQLGRTEEALEEYRSATRVTDPSIPLQARARAHYNLAVALLADGRPEEAAAELREAVRLAPDYEKARQALARLGEPR